MAEENQNNKNTKSDDEYSLDWLFDDHEEEEDIKAKKQEAEDIFWKHWGNDSASSAATTSTAKKSPADEEFDWFLGQKQPAKPDQETTTTEGQPMVVDKSQSNTYSDNTGNSNPPSSQNGIKVATAKVPASSVNSNLGDKSQHKQQQTKKNDPINLPNDQASQSDGSGINTTNDNINSSSGSGNLRSSYSRSIIILCLLITLLSLGAAGYAGYTLLATSKTCYNSKIVLAQTYIGQPLLVNIDDQKRAAAILEQGYTDGRISHLLYTMLKPGDMFVDVGAGYGYQSLYASRIVGVNGKVYSIEPDKYTASMLGASMRLNGINNVFVYNSIIYSEVKDGETNNAETNNLNNNNPSPLTTLDLLLPQLNSVSLIYINTNGNINQVIFGAKRVIIQSPNIKIVVNITKESFSVYNAAAAFTQLANLGFKFWIVNQNDSNLRPVNSLSEIEQLEESSVLIAREI